MTDFRYKKLGYVALEVSDLERAVQFQREVMTLELSPVIPSTPEMAVLRSPAANCELILFASDGPRLRRVAFEMEDDANLDGIVARLRGLGITVDEVPADLHRPLGQRRALRFLEPTSQLCVELFLGDGTPVAPFPVKPGQTNISRLGHVLVNAVESVTVVKFFVEVMNFRVSDYLGTGAFMRCFPNPLHHSFGIMQSSSRTGLNHVNFMTEHFDDVGRAFHRVSKRNIPIVFGPGRHPPSGSFFLYFLDPDGFTFEFSNGMETFPELEPREPQDFELIPTSLDSWGSPFDAERFGAVGPVRRLVDVPAGI